MSAFNCPECGKTTGGNENFCIECGHALNVVCPKCGETWRFMFDYKFCPVCGHHIRHEEVTKRAEEQVFTTIIVKEVTVDQVEKAEVKKVTGNHVPKAKGKK